jgi:hypothetical protein
MVLLFDLTINKIKDFSQNEVMDKLYYLEARLPTTDELKKIKNINIDEIKNIISSIENKIPLYDPITENLYLINKDQVYHRVVRLHYRFPDQQLLKELDLREQEIKKNDSTPLLLRTLRKLQLMREFLSQFNLKILNETYIKVFYYYSNEVGKNLTACKRPSFLPQFSHIPPYYNRSEMINLGLNMGLIEPDNTFYDGNKLIELCDKIKQNDVSADTLLQHQNYISDSKNIGLVQYYTLQGSYFMNQYLRNMTNYNYHNYELERLIKIVYKLITNAPAFDKPYILYRFIKHDPHLRDLKIGDIYTADAFLSTTRDPFYRSDEFVFGFILVKIQLPKNIKGVGLCLENYSHFPNEQEIVLPPNCEMKLVSKDKNCSFFHVDDNYESQIKTRYEFELLKVGELNLEKREEPPELKEIKFAELIPLDSMSLEERIRSFVQNHVSKSYQYKLKLDGKTIIIFIEWYNSSGVYRELYAAHTEHGFCMYSFHESNILFMIELGEYEDIPYMYVNYYFKHSSIGETVPIKQQELLKLWAEIAHYFQIQKVRIYANYKSCDLIIRREGGNFCVDHYQYLKNNIKRFDDTDIKRHEFREGFDYFLLDKLKTINPDKILQKTDRDELYQIYQRVFPKQDDNLATFYVFIVENYCFLINILIKKMFRIFQSDNPFEKDYYIFYPMTYLYNRGKIDYIPSDDNGSMGISSDETDGYVPPILPKNRYRQNNDLRQRK